MGTDIKRYVDVEQDLSAIQVGMRPISQRKRDPRGALVSPGHGHGIVTIGPGYDSDPPVPEIQAYEKAIEPEVRQRLGSRWDHVFPVVGSVGQRFSH